MSKPAHPAIQRRIPKMAAPDGRQRPMIGPDAPGTPDAPMTLTAAKTEKARQEAIRARRINAHEAGELVPAADVEREWLDLAATIRAGLLAVPARVAAAHPGQAEVVNTLRQEIEAALHALAEDRL